MAYGLDPSRLRRRNAPWHALQGKQLNAARMSRCDEIGAAKFRCTKRTPRRKIRSPSQLFPLKALTFKES
jgi:hypothetical protein